MGETVAAPVRRVRTQDQAAAVVGRIGAAQVQLSRLKASLDVAVAQANLAYETAAAPLRTAIAADTELLRGYFDANRASLLSGTKKSVALSTGTMGVKKTTAKLVVADADTLLTLLEEDRKLRRFIRTKSEVDRAALLAEPKVAVTIPGVSIEGGDDAFFVKPLTVSAA
ncbi:host-nuclease inhibitor Gam family protein [Azospirillum lipoferum]|uniref:Mu-like prophage host-nuclease inhibitor protein Gam n=1 Tax=Azospirillum lipoferum (strain 4B) TaxID=862719 RepID=G7ZAE8_AZOL4|nr:host-nuclease inhibitor Gam family protein [Azospirillum lipoferum]CBS88705.1 putative Mu-like prophage host-nuclease inhibitor protein Gam [Azospirillum lipoferum 4B]